jgi:Cytochrome P450
MTRDEQMYPEAELFNPERFMKQNGKEADQTDPRDFVFGFGRRQVLYSIVWPFFVILQLHILF